MLINGNTVWEDNPNFPHIYTSNGDGYYRFRIVLPVGFNNGFEAQNILKVYMKFYLMVGDVSSYSNRIYISL